MRKKIYLSSHKLFMSSMMPMKDLLLLGNKFIFCHHPPFESINQIHVHCCLPSHQDLLMILLQMIQKINPLLSTQVLEALAFRKGIITLYLFVEYLHATVHVLVGGQMATCGKLLHSFYREVPGNQTQARLSNKHLNLLTRLASFRFGLSGASCSQCHAVILMEQIFLSDKTRIFAYSTRATHPHPAFSVFLDHSPFSCSASPSSILHCGLTKHSIPERQKEEDTLHSALVYDPTQQFLSYVGFFYCFY